MMTSGELVECNLLSAENPLPQDSSASNSLENQELDQTYVSSSARKLLRDNNQDPTPHSQELVRSGESASSASTRSEVTVQSKGQGLEFHNMQIFDHRFLEQVFKNLRQKLNLA